MEQELHDHLPEHVVSLCGYNVFAGEPLDCREVPFNAPAEAVAVFLPPPPVPEFLVLTDVPFPQRAPPLARVPAFFLILMAGVMPISFRVLKLSLVS